jgi:hypothetical protein
LAVVVAGAAKTANARTPLTERVEEEAHRFLLSEERLTALAVTADAEEAYAPEPVVDRDRSASVCSP